MTRVRGFSLPELLVVMAILAIVAAASAPTLRTSMANARIRAAGEAWRSGLEMARADAVRLNIPVEFISTDSGWQVNRVDDPTAVLHRGTGREGKADLIIGLTPADADRITFNSFGATLTNNLNGDGPPLTQIDITAVGSQTLTGVKARRIQLLASGNARLCDPLAYATQIGACQ